MVDESAPTVDEQAESKADKNRLAYVGRKPGGRDSSSWYTPADYVERVREVLGRIDLDPFSSRAANEIVRASRFITAEEDAFEAVWAPSDPVTVFMNPPYSRGTCAEACARFLDEWECGNIQTAVVLTNNATDTNWCQSMLIQARASCFTNHRISFWNADGKAVSGNTRGQIFMLFGGHDTEVTFREVFEECGVILQ